MNAFFALVLAFAAGMPPLTINYDTNVTALKLYDDYRKDKTKADKLYEGKRLFLHGIVKVESANMSVVYLVIPGHGDDDVTAVIDDHALTLVPIYKPGDKFDLVCTGFGIVFNLPLVRNCKPLN